MRIDACIARDTRGYDTSRDRGERRSGEAAWRRARLASGASVAVRSLTRNTQPEQQRARCVVRGTPRLMATGRSQSLPAGARLCDRLLFGHIHLQLVENGALSSEKFKSALLPPPISTGTPPEQVDVDADGSEEQSSAWERAHWAALGLGCTWFINDSLFLQLPYWVASQPEGLKLGGNISLAASVANPATVLLALLLRRFAFRATMRAAVLVLICFSLAAGGVLACGAWRVSSDFIYLAVVLASTVGGLTPWLTIPWLLHSGYKPALISPLFLGGSLGSLTSAVIAIWQSPGQHRRFSPSMFFAIATAPILVSLLAYVKIQHEAIGLAVRKSSASTAVQGGCLPRGWRRWICSALPLATWIAFVTMCTWSVSRAVMGFSAAHTVIGHHACEPNCATICATYANKTACVHENTCAAGVTDHGGFVCQEDKGELWIGWITSLAQWAYTSGICFTMLIPSFDLWRVSLLWSVGFGMLMTSAVVRDGMFETHWGGPFVLCSALLVRGADGYLETMIWRVIAHQYRSQRCEQDVVLFYGLMAMAVNLVGSTASDWLIQTGLIGD